MRMAFLTMGRPEFFFTNFFLFINFICFFVSQSIVITNCSILRVYESFCFAQNNARALLWTCVLIILPGIAYASIVGS